MAAPLSTAVFLAAAPLPAHLHGAAEDTGGFPFLGSVSLYVLVVLAGALAAPALSRVSAGRRVRGISVAALLALYAGLVVAQVVRHEQAAAVAAGVLTALVVAASAIWRDHRLEQLAAAIVLVAAQGPVVGTGAGKAHLAGVLLHLVAASVWIGGVLHVVTVVTTRGKVAGALAARRFSVFAVSSTALLVGSGTVLMVVHHIGRSVLFGSTYGAVLLAKMSALALAIALGLAMRRRASRQPTRAWPRLIRTEAVVLAGALGLGAVLVGLADPQPAFAAVAPGLGHLQMGDESGTFFVVRRDTSTGWLLYDAGDDDAPRVRIADGTDRVWSPSNDDAQIRAIALKHGVARLTVRYEHKTVHLRLPAVAPSATVQSSDPEDQVQLALGRAVAAAATGESLASSGCVTTTSAESEGTAVGRSLGALGVHVVAARGDATPRSRAFITGLRGGGLRLRATAATVVLTGDRDSALEALHHLAGKAPRGIYLAPWLLDSTVLAATAQRNMPLIAVASVTDPMAPLADHYRDALAVLAARVAPTETGLLGFLSGVGSGATPRSLRIYAAAPIGFLPGVLNVGHQHNDPSAWLPGGTLVPMTAARPLAVRCVG
jgi:putative copper export protein